MKYCTLFIIAFLLPFAANAQQKAENVFLITLDGLRWEELFTGADSLLMTNEAYVNNVASLQATYWAGTPNARREKLMPFVWSTIVAEGQIWGNRLKGSHAYVVNNHVFSFPGYNEILSGFADDRRIQSNDKVPNPNVTVLEHIHRQPGFEGKVAAFGSWDVFPYIVNEERSGIPVNAGFEASADTPLTDREAFLNTLQEEIPSPWPAVRLDAFTHHYALEHIKKHRPRLVYIAYGETDDFAHGGSYNQYLDSAHRTDQFIAELWAYVQGNEQYRDKTTFVITTDHGRGKGPAWTTHGDGVAGARAIWVMALGAGVPAKGELHDADAVYQNQVARTVAELLGFKDLLPKKAGAALPFSH